MNGAKTHWVIVGLAAIVGALAALLVAAYLRQSPSRVAFGQTGEAAASGNYVLALLGSTYQDATPLVLIDTKAQTILVYEFMVSRHTMYLRSARSYLNDRELTFNNFFAGDVYSGPSVDDIRNMTRTRR